MGFGRHSPIEPQKSTNAARPVVEAALAHAIKDKTDKAYRRDLCQRTHRAHAALARVLFVVKRRRETSSARDQLRESRTYTD
jgi:hypothetical protein